MIWSLTEKKYVSAIATSADIIIKLFLFFTKSFRNPSFIFYIGIDTRYSSISLSKVVCKLRMCDNPNRCHCPSREFVVCCLNSFCIEGWCMTTTERYLSYTLYRCDVCTYTFQSCDQSSLSLHDHRYQRSIPLLAHMLLYQTTEDRGRSHPTLSVHNHTSWRWSPQVGAILWAQKPFCEVVTTAP